MFLEVKNKILKATKTVGRDPDQVELIAVSKQQPEARIERALNEGFRVFGENRVQEAKGRWQPRRPFFPDLELHLIGPLQSNKAGDAVALFDIIHTLDRPKIVRAIKTEMDNQNRPLPCFIQVNTGDEPQKAGVLPKELPDFHHFCRSEIELDIIGLMCIPPIHEEAVMHFALLKTLADELSLSKLSMGMSGDYEDAIALGATHIRVGSALFGARP